MSNEALNNRAKKRLKHAQQQYLDNLERILCEVPKDGGEVETSILGEIARLKELLK